MIDFQSPEFARDMRHGEEPAVDAWLADAFQGTAESRLVAALRKNRAIAGETVLPMGDRIIGYYALCYMVAPKGWLCLAPVAIAPAFQRRGYGKRMLGVLTEWARLTKTPIIVVGDPTFYQRVGFSSAAAQDLQSPYPIAQTLLAGVSGTPVASLTYPKAFESL